MTTRETLRQRTVSAPGGLKVVFKDRPDAGLQPLVTILLPPWVADEEPQYFSSVDEALDWADDVLRWYQDTLEEDSHRLASLRRKILRDQQRLWEVSALRRTLEQEL